MLAFLASSTGELAVIAMLVLVAASVQFLAPFKRHKIRKASILTATQFACFLGAVASRYVETIPWEARFTLAADLLAAVVFVQAAAILTFDVVLPRIGVRVLSITSDLTVGVGYIFATISVLRGAGLNPTEVVATGAVVSAVVALSLQSTLGNILGGVALQVD
jgi:small-conductance mechanosensitive channel